MKLNVALSTLASISTLAHALPNQKFQFKRQTNSTGSGLGATGLNATAPNGGNGVDAQGTGFTTTTVVSTVTTTISQAYTTFLSTSLTTATLVFPAGSAATAQGGSGAAAQPNTGSTSSANAVAPAVIPGSVGVNGICACSVPTVVATGIYTATVVRNVNLGSTTYATSYPTQTIGVLTIAGGSVIAAVPTITQTAVVAADPSAALSAGQSYQTITVPASNGSPAYEIVVVVETVTPVVVSVAPVNPGGDGVGATGLTTSQAPYSNLTMISTASPTATFVSALSADISTTPAPTTIAPGVGAGVGAAQTATSGAVSDPTTSPTTPNVETPTSAALAPNTNAVQVGSLGTTPLVYQQAFINQMLYTHNTYRARHGAPAMTWSDELAAVALTNVNNNAAAGTVLVHTTNDAYGENTAYEYGQNNPDYLVYKWYSEISSYDYSNPGFSDSTGHFTQLVWDASTVLGCAFTQSSDSEGDYLLACEYQQPGNVAGEFETEVNALLPNQPAVVAPSGTSP